MQADRWDVLSAWLNAWLAADAAERDRLHAQLAAEHPDLVREAETLTVASGQLPGFLEIPAVVLAAGELAREDPTLPVGSAIGPYRVVSFLARGGMGDVYRATDTRLHRDVALKVLAETKTGDPQRVERFMHEARVTASLDHPNIVRVFDVGRVQDRAYLVAELLEGETLRVRISRGPMPVDEVVRIGVEIANGLVAAHAAGLVHRDLKPENIFLTKSGTTKLLDFGIAKLAQDEGVRDGFSTLTGVVLGTAGYLAPEQIRGQAIDTRADLFALGSVLFEMLTGTRAFAREHIVETLHAILHDRAPDLLAERPNVPPMLADIVMRLLEKSPAARIQSASEVIEALQRVDSTVVSHAQHQKVPRAKFALTYKGPYAQRVRRTSTVLWAAVALILAVASIAMVWRWIYPASPGANDSSVTLAVMPFRSIPAATDNDLLAVGFADVFISRLSQLPDVRVLPLTATERLRGQDPLEAARSLGATHVLSVTLQRDQGSVRAVPQLLAAGDGRMIWSTNVDADASSIFSIQDIIVGRVIQELAPELGAGARSRIAGPGTANNDAHDAYLRGRGHVLRPTPTDLQTAAQWFRRAVTLDEHYADAWAGLGSAYKRMPMVIGTSPDPLAEAKTAAERALRLDAQHAEAISVLGTVAFWHERDYAKSEQLLRKALELQPSSPDTQLFLAHLLSNIGRHDEAVKEIRSAGATDLAWPLPKALEAQFLYHARRYDVALAHLDRVGEVQPRFWLTQVFRALVLIALGRYDEALNACDRVFEFRRILDISEPPYSFAVALKGYAYARSGRPNDAGMMLDELLRQARLQYTSPHHLALVMHALGRDEDALVRLRDAVNVRDAYVTFLGVDPKWDGLRDSPAFKEVLTSANLLDVSNRIQR